MAIKITEVPADAEDAQTQTVTRSHIRDDDQKAMDTRVKALVDEWEKAGKPEQDKAPYRRLTVPADDKTPLKKLIRRACVMFKVEPLYWLDTKPNDAGEITVKFTVGALKPKAEKPADEKPADEKPATDTPPDNPAADQGGDQPQTDQKRGGLLSGRR